MYITGGKAYSLLFYPLLSHAGEGKSVFTAHRCLSCVFCTRGCGTPFAAPCSCFGSSRVPWADVDGAPDETILILVTFLSRSNPNNTKQEDYVSERDCIDDVVKSRCCPPPFEHIEIV